MRKLLFILSLTITQLAYADCVKDFVHCNSAAAFQNSYKLETVRCIDPQGAEEQTTTFYIYNNLVNNSCSPVAFEECLKPIFEMELNTYRHTFFQADLKMDGPYVLLKIDDRRFMMQGAVNLSTPNHDYILLNDYLCSFNGK